MTPSSSEKDAASPCTSPGNSVRVGHVYLDVARRSLQCLNPAARQLYHAGVPLTPTDLAHHPLLTPSGEPITVGELPMVVAYRERRPVDADFLLPRAGGVAWRVAWSATPVRDAGSNIIGVLGTVIGRPPEPDWRAVLELTHDLRTPLQSLRLIDPLLARLTPEDAELRKALEFLRATAERALEIGLELVEHCRGPVQRKTVGELTWFPLEPFLMSLAQEQSAAASKKNLTLATDFAAVEGWDIYSNRVKLGRVLANLLVNAVRYTAQGEVRFTAAWRDEPGGRVLALGVVDTGPGMSETERESVFQPFERGQAGKEDSGGSGLGLAVVDRLVEELGLSLDVYSEYGHGSSFHLLVPARFLRPPGGSHDSFSSAGGAG